MNMKKMQKLAQIVWVLGFVAMVAMVAVAAAELCGAKIFVEIANVIAASAGWVIGATVVALAGDIVLRTRLQFQM